MIYLFGLAKCIVYIILIITIIDFILMGFPVPSLYPKCRLKSYCIQKKNRFDIQKHFECAAFSSAYVMRHFDLEAKGMDLYQTIPCKMKDGCVFGKGIVKLLARYGISATYHIGTMNSLRQEVSKGNPVIVLIRYTPKKPWLHFVPVVGFDEEHFYVAESLGELVNCEDPTHNRVIDLKSFSALWNTSMLKMPLMTHTYFSIRKK